MRWKDDRRSDNIEDRRGQKVGYSLAAAPVLLRFLPALIRSKTGRTLLIVGVLAVVGGRMLGVDVLSLLAGGGATPSGEYQASPQEEELKEFLAVILGQTEDVWGQIFAQNGQRYVEPTLILFSGAVNSACGRASAAVGPFYCPGDQQVYLDMSFFRDLAQRHGAPGDFAQAYVLAHEVGHHVQTLTGTSQQVQQAGARASEAQRNALSVRQELQADCYAGLWGHAADFKMNRLDPGDLDEALVAAAAIGDDRLQREASGQVVPDSFTHGSSEQRVRWFRRGYESGDPGACDTFSAKVL